MSEKKTKIGYSNLKNQLVVLIIAYTSLNAYLILS